VSEERFEQDRAEAAKSWKADELRARQQGLFELAVYLQEKVRLLSAPSVSFQLYKALSQPRGPAPVINQERRLYVNPRP
jgi:hypothetical protein